jgi:hypothetical protein
MDISDAAIHHDDVDITQLIGGALGTSDLLIADPPYTPAETTDIIILRIMDRNSRLPNPKICNG